MLRVALGLRLDQLPSASQQVGRSRLLDLIARAFLAALEPLLHEGLAKGYRSTRSNGSVFRGRLAIADHLRDNIARADRVFVEYQTFDHDIVVNRALACALDVLSTCAVSTSVALGVGGCLARFPDVDTATFNAMMFERIRLGRSTERYADALVYARMILAQQGPQLRAGRERVFALLFDMNLLWERYIAVLLRRAAPAGLAINTQESHPFWRPASHGARRVRPDVVVRDDATADMLVIDTHGSEEGPPLRRDLSQMSSTTSCSLARAICCSRERRLRSMARPSEQQTGARGPLRVFEVSAWSPQRITNSSAPARRIDRGSDSIAAAPTYHSFECTHIGWSNGSHRSRRASWKPSGGVPMLVSQLRRIATSAPSSAGHPPPRPVIISMRWCARASWRRSLATATFVSARTNLRSRASHAWGKSSLERRPSPRRTWAIGSQFQRNGLAEARASRSPSPVTA